MVMVSGLGNWQCFCELQRSFEIPVLNFIVSAFDPKTLTPLRCADQQLSSHLGAHCRVTQRRISAGKRRGRPDP